MPSHTMCTSDTALISGSDKRPVYLGTELAKKLYDYGSLMLCLHSRCGWESRVRSLIWRSLDSRLQKESEFDKAWGPALGCLRVLREEEGVGWRTDNFHPVTAVAVYFFSCFALLVCSLVSEHESCFLTTAPTVVYKIHQIIITVCSFLRCCNVVTERKWKNKFAFMYLCGLYPQISCDKNIPKKTRSHTHYLQFLYILQNTHFRTHSIKSDLCCIL